MYQSQSDKERFCRSEAKARLVAKNYGNHVVFQDSPHFLLFLSYFVSTHKTVDNKAVDPDFAVF